MRLTELDPRWIELDGKRIGLTFLCPCCKKDRLTCFTMPTAFRDQIKLMHATMKTTPADEDDWPINWVPANAKAKWSLSNLDNFETLSIKPSIDASASGNWHGWVKNGAITK